MRICQSAPSGSPKTRKSRLRPPQTQNETATRPRTKRFGESTRLERETLDAAHVRELVFFQRSDRLGDSCSEILGFDLALDFLGSALHLPEPLVLEDVRRDAVEVRDEAPGLAAGARARACAVAAFSS